MLAMFVVISNSSLDNFENTTLALKKNACDCVIFRLDDIRNGYLENIQLDLMDYFISHNQSLSLGLIMNELANGSSVFHKVNEGYKKGIFELGIHGWNHVDYTSLDEIEQKTSLIRANEKMLSLFGNRSEVFIPPFNLFDNHTITVMKNLKFGILSSAIYYDEPQVIKTQQDYSDIGMNIIHMPEMTDFSIYYNNSWVKVPIKFLMADIDFDINTYGYSVIMVHPHNFAIQVNGTLIDKIDQNQMKSLNALMQVLIHKDFKIVKLSDVAGRD